MTERSPTTTGNPNTKALANDQYTVGSFVNSNPTPTPRPHANPNPLLTKLIVCEQKRNKYKFKQNAAD